MLFTIGYRTFSASINVNSLTDTPGRESGCLSQELGFHPQLPDLTLKLAQARFDRVKGGYPF
jgi:hypothetical protein